MAFIGRYIGQYAVDYSKPPKYEDTHFSRKERRWIKKLEKEKEKALGKLGIKNQRVIITHSMDIQEEVLRGLLRF